MTDNNEQRSEANTLLGAGLGIGAFGAASGLLLGAVCPMCIVATPALIGMGLYKHACLRRTRAAPGPVVTPMEVTSELSDGST